MKFYDEGFILAPDEIAQVCQTSGKTLARPFVSGRDLTGSPRGLFEIDADGRTELKSICGST